MTNALLMLATTFVSILLREVCSQKIIQGPLNVNSTVGNKVSFSCTIANKTKTMLSWQKLGSPAEILFQDTFKDYRRPGENRDNQKYEIKESIHGDGNITYTLTVNNIDKTDNGSYMCRLLTKNYPQANASLLVLIPPKFETGTPRMIKSVEGENATLFCNVSGIPLPKVTWSRNDRRPMPQGTTSRNGAIYFIEAVNRSDSAIYICEAMNGVPPNPIRLDVKMKVSFPVTVRDAEPVVRQQPNKGYEAHLLCIGNGYPTPTTRWYKVVGEEGQEREIVADFKKFSMQTIAGVEKHSSDIQIQLTIHNVVGDDFGNYTCRVENILSKDNSYIVFERAESRIESKALSDPTSKLNKKETRYVLDADSSGRTENGQTIITSSLLIVTLSSLIVSRIT